MKLTKTHKIIIGLLGVTALAYLTRKHWMPKKKENPTNPTISTGNVNTQSAPTSTSVPATTSTSKRSELIAKLKDSMKNGSLILNLDDTFFNSLNDKELLSMVVMGDVEKATSDENAQAILKKNNITPNDLKVIGEKMKSYFEKLKK